MNGQYSVQLNPLILLTSQKEISMCLLMSYNNKYTILPIKCSCQKLESEFDQAFRSNSLQEIQGTVEHVKGNGKALINKVLIVGNSTGKISWFQIEGVWGRK